MVTMTAFGMWPIIKPTILQRVMISCLRPLLLLLEKFLKELAVPYQWGTANSGKPVMVGNCQFFSWDRGKVKGRDAYVSLFVLMFLFACTSSIGVVDSAFSADTVRLRFEPRSSQYVKTSNNFAFYDSNLFLSWLSKITISFSITVLY